jgi:hypothetical protein
VVEIQCGNRELGVKRRYDTSGFDMSGFDTIEELSRAIYYLITLDMLMLFKRYMITKLDFYSMGYDFRVYNKIVIIVG